MIMKISQRTSLRRQLDDDKVRRIFHLRSIRGLRYESHLGTAPRQQERLPTQAQTSSA